MPGGPALQRYPNGKGDITASRDAGPYGARTVCPDGDLRTAGPAGPQIPTHPSYPRPRFLPTPAPTPHAPGSTGRQFSRCPLDPK